MDKAFVSRKFDVRGIKVKWDSHTFRLFLKKCFRIGSSFWFNNDDPVLNIFVCSQECTLLFVKFKKVGYSFSVSKVIWICLYVSLCYFFNLNPCHFIQWEEKYCRKNSWLPVYLVLRSSDNGEIFGKIEVWTLNDLTAKILMVKSDFQIPENPHIRNLQLMGWRWHFDPIDEKTP